PALPQYPTPRLAQNAHTHRLRPLPRGIVLGRSPLRFAPLAANAFLMPLTNFHGLHHHGGGYLITLMAFAVRALLWLLLLMLPKNLTLLPLVSAKRHSLCHPNTRCVWREHTQRQRRFRPVGLRQYS